MSLRYWDFYDEMLKTQSHLYITLCTLLVYLLMSFLESNFDKLQETQHNLAYFVTISWAIEILAFPIVLYILFLCDHVLSLQLTIWWLWMKKKNCPMWSLTRFWFPLMNLLYHVGNFHTFLVMSRIIQSYSSQSIISTHKKHINCNFSLKYPLLHYAGVLLVTWFVNAHSKPQWICGKPL